jgi:1-deoxyxylulose-5-phosphate synthase
MSMRYVRLGRSDLAVSVVALGCGNFGGIGSSPELIGQGEDERAAFALMDTALEQGITLFDTANSYGGGSSELAVGRWMASRHTRDDIALTTKVRNRVGPGPDDEGLSAGHIRREIDNSLRRLGTDHVDLYLAHDPDPSVPITETLGVFDELIRAGKVRPRRAQQLRPRAAPRGGGHRRGRRPGPPRQPAERLQPAGPAQ